MSQGRAARAPRQGSERHVESILWVPLTQFEGPPEVLIRQCRESIDQYARPEEHINLLAVTQVMTRLRFGNTGLLSLLGGSRVMIESPLIQEMLAKKEQETTQKNILSLLQHRFGRVPAKLTAQIHSVVDEQKLNDLLLFASQRSDLKAIKDQLDM